MKNPSKYSEKVKDGEVFFSHGIDMCALCISFKIDGKRFFQPLNLSLRQIKTQRELFNAARKVYGRMKNDKQLPSVPCFNRLAGILN